MTDDRELIGQFCASGSQGAFETIVKRHVDLVYSVAFRQLDEILRAMSTPVQVEPTGG